MTPAAPVLGTHGNAYNIFILVLTVVLAGVMALLLPAASTPTPATS